MITLLLLLALTRAEARTNLYLKQDDVILHFDPSGPFLDENQKIDVQFSASLFKLLLEKSEKIWWSGNVLCVRPDGDDPVGEHIALQAQGYGYAVLHDLSGKKCGPDKQEVTK